MYVEKICIKNMGAIEKFKLDKSRLFNQEGNPKPIIIIGENGKGKTTILSCIVDALYQLQSQTDFLDIPTKDQTFTHFYRVSGSKTQRFNSKYAISAICFNSTKPNQNILCLESIGDVPQKLRTKLQGNFPTATFNGKEVLVIDNDERREIQKNFKEDVYCFFPAERYEIPYWINRDLVENHQDFRGFTLEQSTTSRLEKPLTIMSSLQENNLWVLDILLDASIPLEYEDKWKIRTDELNLDFNQPDFKQVNYHIDKQSAIKWRDNVEKIFKIILDQPQNSFNFCSRRIRHNLGVFINSVPINALSAGENSIWTIFGTILRYADKYYAYPRKLADIKGIVIIDEVDTHLHIKLQNEVLPELIKLFPRIQFIITTHSPFFIAGMKERYSEGDFLFLDTQGKDLSLSDFDDTSHKALNNIKTILVAIPDSLIQTLENKESKTIIITEGKTDVELLRCAKEVLQINLDIDFISANELLNGNSNNEKGDGSAESVKRILEFLTKQTISKTIIGLFDNDSMGFEKFKHEDLKKFQCNNDDLIGQYPNKALYKMLLPIPPETKHYDTRSKTSLFRFFTIEHYFPNDVLENLGIQDRLIIQGEKEIVRINQKNKMDKIKKLCEEGKIEYFQNFKILFDDLQKIIQK